jgi:hypothetical protein
MLLLNRKEWQSQNESETGIEASLNNKEQDVQTRLMNSGQLIWTIKAKKHNKFNSQVPGMPETP